MREPIRSVVERAQDRRVRHIRLRLPERRSGFDRRTAAGWRGWYQSELRGYADRPITFMLVLATIVVFNFIDLHLTIRVLRNGGVEINPIMARLFAWGPLPAATIKLGVIGIVVLALLSLRRFRRTLETSLLLLMTYSGLVLYHVLLAAQMLD